MLALRRWLTRPLDGATIFFCLAILTLNLVDAFATLRHLEHGAAELNPMMLALLHRGASQFLIVKHLLASLGVIAIAIYPQRRAARMALAVLLPLYIGLAAYQMGLFYVM
jgi:hypothetical protein